ncbi:dihydrodipicolinate synthase family protein [Candidatus Pelagibacter sp.]|uniref:dihydrodipicolinate synthase family protein n=1 Tax=Candidatus Pelagibacter sp. TaxID=2024849 RepID=UPI003F828C46
MKNLKGIYAATISVFNDDLSLNIDKTIKHSEKIIDDGCHGVVMFGSTGQAQYISVGEKINLLNQLSKSKHHEKFVIGTGLNSLVEIINFMKTAQSLNFDKFLIMPPAFYSYDDYGVENFYKKIIEAVPASKIILYNFEKLCGFKFSENFVLDLVKKFPDQIVGIKDTTGNLFGKLKIKDFSYFSGTELNLLEGLKIGYAGIITANSNVTAELSRKVFDDYFNKNQQTVNDQLCAIRKEFDKYNTITGLHSYLSQFDNMLENVLPPLSLLKEGDKENLIKNLKELNFELKFKSVA